MKPATPEMPQDIMARIKNRADIILKLFVVVVVVVVVVLVVVVIVY